MEKFVGTSGYSYKEWKGNFYPEKLQANKMLEFYAQKLPAVEINNTFYRLPKASMLESWAAQVPDGFRFSIKASRRITHIKRLRNVEDETRYLLETARLLGPRLGVVLFQLPPKLRKDLPRLQAFLDLLPESTPAAFEFRNESWFADDVFECLSNRDAALCVTDTDDGVNSPVTGTARWGYLRLRRSEYSDDDLAAWRDRIDEQQWERAFVFFKHEDEGKGPQFAGRFIELDGS